MLKCCFLPIVAGFVVAILVWRGGGRNNPFSDDGRIGVLLQQGLTPPPPPPRWVQWLGLQVLQTLENVRELLVPVDVRMVEKIVAIWTAKCIFAAAKLGVGDAIPLSPAPDGWPTAAEIGMKVGVKDSELMYRFLRGLASLGILREHPGKRVSHTEYSVLLNERLGVRSARSLILTWGGGQSYAWDGLADQLLTGENAFKTANGMDMWEYYRQHREEEQHFQRMLGDISTMMTPPLVLDFDWPSAVGGRNASPTVVDVGGGLGSVLALVMAALPNAQGILFDQASVIEQARHQFCWRDGPLASRVHFVAGSFFEKLPPADVFIMRSILHDWNDETSVQILQTIRRAIKPGGKLFLIEHLLPPSGQPSNQLGVPAEMVDLHMLVMLDGKERTAAQFQQILGQAGFSYVATHYTRAVYHIVEAVSDPL